MKWKLPVALLVTGVISLAAGCGGKPSPDVNAPPPKAPKTGFRLTSTAFDGGGKIPATHTEDGEDQSPPLAWREAPDRTRSFVLICEDPDAPGDDPWVHWVIYNLPVTTKALPAGVPRELEPEVVVGARQGQNSWPTENIGYRGPAPPKGDGPHHYHFTLYALDTALELEAGATKPELLDAISSHQLGTAKLIGVYERE